MERLFDSSSTDNSHVRRRVFGLIAATLRDLPIDYVVVDKAKTGPALRDDRRFYPEMLGYLLQFVLHRETRAGNVHEIIVITDRIPVSKKRNAVEKGVQLALARILPSGMKYRILHHSSCSHYGLQIADYCGWAALRKWERGDTEHYDRIKSAIRSEFDIFQNGTRYYH